MAGISDSGNPDDIRVHLEQIISADASRREMVPGESDRERLTRESVLLSSDLEQRVKSSLADIAGAVPGLGDAEATKILTTRAGRDALKKGKRALARVDDHLRSVTGQQNPQIGRAYGVTVRIREVSRGCIVLSNRALPKTLASVHFPQLTPNPNVRLLPISRSWLAKRATSFARCCEPASRLGRSTRNKWSSKTTCSRKRSP